MKHADRRLFLHAMGWSFALPALGLPLSLSARERPVVFPTRPVALRRVLVRDLGSGKFLTVTRQWECRFSRNGSGASVDARQMSVAVDAPPALAALAQMERSREVKNLFPMVLDGRGTIKDWSSQSLPIDAAVARAREQIDKLDLAAAERASAKRYLSEMGRTAASMVSQVPTDLFFPASGEKHEQRMIDLPDGSKGSFEIALRTQSCPESGLLRSSERRITTRIGDSSRTSSEVWSIA